MPVQVNSIRANESHVRLPMIIAARVGRTLLLMLFAAVGTILLVRFAPGFFSDLREMDARYAQAARAEIQSEDNPQETIVQVARHEFEGWIKGDFGESRQYHVPVAELIGARLKVSALLLAQGILRGWLLALCAALPVSGLFDLEPISAGRLNDKLGLSAEEITRFSHFG